MSKSKIASDAAEYQKILGDRIRRVRRERQLTQLDLARQVGVTNGQISTIERGLSAPSIGTLLRIASALNVSVVDFFDPSQPGEFEVVRTEERRRILNPAGPEVVHLLAEADSMVAVQLDLAPSAMCRRPPRREPTDLFMFVLAGEFEVSCDHKQVVLAPGDSARTDGRLTHTIRNIGEVTGHLLEVRASYRG